MLLDHRQIYFRLKDISGCEDFLSKIRGFIKLGKKPCEMLFFFSFLILNISSSIKEPLQKPSEIKWNRTRLLLGKLKRKFSWALSYKILPPEITKTWEIAILGGTLWAWEPLWSSMVFKWFCEFLKFLVSIFRLKTVLTLN